MNKSRFDTIREGLRQSMLDEARKGRGPEALTEAVLMLTRADGTRYSITHANEYGDGDGLQNMRDFREEILRTETLREGESVDVLVFSVPLDLNLCRPDKTRKPRRKAG
jgi:hypothetical protein